MPTPNTAPHVTSGVQRQLKYPQLQGSEALLGVIGAHRTYLSGQTTAASPPVNQRLPGACDCDEDCAKNFQSRLVEARARADAQGYRLSTDADNRSPSRTCARTTESVDATIRVRLSNFGMSLSSISRRMVGCVFLIPRPIIMDHLRYIQSPTIFRSSFPVHIERGARPLEDLSKTDENVGSMRNTCFASLKPVLHHEHFPRRLLVLTFLRTLMTSGS